MSDNPAIIMVILIILIATIAACVWAWSVVSRVFGIDGEALLALLILWSVCLR